MNRHSKRVQAQLDRLTPEARVKAEEALTRSKQNPTINRDQVAALYADRPSPARADRTRRDRPRLRHDRSRRRDPVDVARYPQGRT